MAFEMIVKTMIELNLFELFFPWLLTLAVTFGALDKYDFFEEESINAVIALAVSFIAIGGLYLFVPASLFSHFAAAVAFTAFGLIGLLVLLALAGVDIDDLDRDGPLAKAAMAIGGIAFLGVLFIQFNIQEPLFQTLAQLMEEETFDEVVMPILTLLFLLGVFGMITRGSGSEESQ